MESKLPENFRVEETPLIQGEKKQEEPAVKPAKAAPFNELELAIMVGQMKAELQALRAELAAAKAAPISPKPAVEEPAEETEPEPEVTPPPAPRKPKTVVPQGAASKRDVPDEDGMFRVRAG